MHACMQFLAGLAFVSTHTSFAKTMEAAFKACDVNGDGTLSRDEVERSLLAIFPELPPITVCTLPHAATLLHQILNYLELVIFHISCILVTLFHREKP